MLRSIVAENGHPPSRIVGDLDSGYINPSIAGRAARRGTRYKRRSVGGVVADEFVKYGLGDTEWVRSKESALVAGGMFAAKYPAILTARTAAQVQDVIRAIAGDPALAAAPSHLWAMQEVGSTVDAVDLVGAVPLASTGAGATRIASAWADGALDLALHTISANAATWRAANGASCDVTVGAFSIVCEIKASAFAGGGAYFLAKQPGDFAAWYGFYAGAGDRIGFICYDGTHLISAEVVADHTNGSSIIVSGGHSVTAGKVWCSTTLGAAQTADTSLASLTNTGKFGFAGQDGTSQATADCSFLAFFEGANAESIYTHRAALVAASGGLLDT